MRNLMILERALSSLPCDGKDEGPDHVINLEPGLESGHWMVGSRLRHHSFYSKVVIVLEGRKHGL